MWNCSIHKYEGEKRIGTVKGSTILQIMYVRGGVTIV